MVGSVIFTNPVKRFASKKESIPCLLMICIQWGTTTNDDDDADADAEDTVRNDERTVRVVVDTANLASVVSSPSLPPPSSFASSSIQHGVVVVVQDDEDEDEDGSVATDDTQATNCCKDPIIVILCAKDQRQKDKFVERREIRKWNRYSIPKWTIHKTTATLPNENEEEDTAVLFFLFFVVSSVNIK